jgi:hypothetical protein
VGWVYVHKPADLDGNVGAINIDSAIFSTISRGSKSHAITENFLRKGIKAAGTLVPLCNKGRD